MIKVGFFAYNSGQEKVIYFLHFGTDGVFWKEKKLAFFIRDRHSLSLFFIQCTISFVSLLNKIKYFIPMQVH
jgi:hypothetical protein